MNTSIKILVVDDEAIAVLTMKELCKEWGYELCGVASNGIAAIECARVNQPDVILMDIGLQGTMDGIEATEKICSICHAKTIFLTGYRKEDYAKRVAWINPLAVFEKPIDFEKVHELIENVKLQI